MNIKIAEESNLIMRFTKLFIAVTMLAGVGVSCSDRNMPVGGMSTSMGNGKGAVAMKLTDFPIDNASVTKVLVNIKKIQIHSDVDGWFDVIDYGDTGRVFDLLTLTNGRTADLGYFQLDEGKYNQIRILLADEHQIEVIENGNLETLPLKIPSGTQTGIKLVRSFDVSSDGTVEFVLDFDAQKSISYNRGQGYIMKPTIKILSHEVTPGVTKRISASKGGTITILNQIALNIPPGALSEDTDISIVPRDEASSPTEYLAIPLTSYELLPHGLQFNSDIRLEMNYDKSALNLLFDTAGVWTLDESILDIVYYDEEATDYVSAAATVDSDAGKVSANINHFSEWSNVADLRDSGVTSYAVGEEDDYVIGTPMTQALFEKNFTEELAGYPTVTYMYEHIDFRFILQILFSGDIEGFSDLDVFYTKNDLVFGSFVFYHDAQRHDKCDSHGFHTYGKDYVACGDDWIEDLAHRCERLNPDNFDFNSSSLASATVSRLYGKCNQAKYVFSNGIRAHEEIRAYAANPPDRVVIPVSTAVMVAKWIGYKKAKQIVMDFFDQFKDSPHKFCEHYDYNFACRDNWSTEVSFDPLTGATSPYAGYKECIMDRRNRDVYTRGSYNYCAREITLNVSGLDEAVASDSDSEHLMVSRTVGSIGRIAGSVIAASFTTPHENGAFEIRSNGNHLVYGDRMHQGYFLTSQPILTSIVDKTTEEFIVRRYPDNGYFLHPSDDSQRIYVDRLVAEMYPASGGDLINDAGIWKGSTYNFPLVKIESSPAGHECFVVDHGIDEPGIFNIDPRITDNVEVTIRCWKVAATTPYTLDYPVTETYCEKGGSSELADGLSLLFKAPLNFDYNNYSFLAINHTYGDKLLNRGSVEYQPSAIDITHFERQHDIHWRPNLLDCHSNNYDFKFCANRAIHLDFFDLVSMRKSMFSSSMYQTEDFSIHVVDNFGQIYYPGISMSGMPRDICN